MGKLGWLKKQHKKEPGGNEHPAFSSGLDERSANIIMVERDICHLYHLLSGYDGDPAMFPFEVLDFEHTFTMPYWECLNIDLDEVGLDRRDFIREGCLVMIYEMAYSSMEHAHSHLRDKLPACREAIGEMDFGLDRVRALAGITLNALDSAESSKSISGEMLEECAVLFYDYVIPYFRKRGRRARTPMFFREDDPVKAERQEMDWHIREAEKAYGRLYSAKTGTDATAAYNDCKECLDKAISLARQTGLEEKMNELENKLQHYKGVFRSQFG